ncbi:copper resistance protein CopC [Streptomyces sp. KM273126]|uniref:copper resistance CopC/CopD family protein n=1 Tax=Streptomyces sp. KM273126 TaxID=2545247 RepID=UPI00215DA04C|nr:copper resistance protein CopC [Streptomyces sp. KM273126]
MVSTVLAFLLSGAGPASAHATLTRSEPADVSILKAAPRQITLAFSESVSLSNGSLRVLSPKNERVDRGTVTHAGGKADTARVMLSGALPEGTYTVSWRVVSADSHSITGAFTFSIGEPSATSAVAAPSAATPDDTAASRLYDAFRYIAYGGLALLIGVALFMLVCWPAGSGLRPLRRLLLAGWTALFASTVVLLLLRGPYETGRGLTAVSDLSLLGQTITGRSGLALGARLLLLAVVGILGWRFATRLGGRPDGTRQGSAADAADAAAPTHTSSGSCADADDPPAVEWQFGTRAYGVGVLFAVALALTWALAEHAATGIQVPLAILVAVLHLLAMAVWLGGLLALAVALFRAPVGTVIPAAAVARFSRLAFTAVVVLVATGLYQSWRQIGSMEALATTEYGRLLTIKVAAVILVVTAAAFSRQWAAQLGHRPPSSETLPATVGQRARVAQTVGAGASSGGDAFEDTDSAGPPAPRAPADSPAASDASSESDRHRRGLRRSVAAEAVLGVVVLAITTLLTGTQPSRAAVQSAAVTAAAQEPTARVVTVPFDVGIPNGQGKAQITFSPGRVGDNTVEVLVYGPDGGVATVPEIRLTLTQRAQRIGPLDAKLANQGGYWAADRLRLPVPGTWTVQVTVRTSDIDQVTVSKNVNIRPLPKY